VKDHRGSVEGATLAWTGDGNNVCNSLMLACTLVGAHVRVATPKGFEPPAAITAKAKEYAAKSGAQLLLTNDPMAAARGADFLYTDVWASMGQEGEAAQRAQIFRPFQLNKALLDVAAKGAKVLHCLPAHRGEEISAEVLDGPNSIVLDQAENRLHAQRALLHRLLGKTSQPKGGKK
jgi:ornithine carbamoyltransferase